MTLPNLPVKYQKWLNERGISDEVLFKNCVHVEDEDIVIPINGPDGRFLYNKYRRNPWSEEGSKYRYDKGAGAALYNLNSALFSNDVVLICEGELDAMALQSKGYYAVSTTGGAGTFKEEWAPFLKDNEIYIVYDNDFAGIDGTIRLLKFFPHARVVFIPRTSHIKDVTDFLKTYPLEAFDHLMQEAQEWSMPKTKEECSVASALFESRRQEMLRFGKDTDFVDESLKRIGETYDSLKVKKKKDRSTIRDGDAIERAKQVPIGEYIQFNKKGDALCINHDDKHPSMHWFKKNNRVKCFACGYSADVIDVVQKLFTLTTGEAIKKINGV